MSANINRVNITGNLTRDAEVRETAGGTRIVGFSVAVNDRRKNGQTGEWEDVANFVDCVMFCSEAQARWAVPILHKGAKVAVEGKLRWSSWEAKDGSGRRSKLEVVVGDWESMQGKSGGADAQQAATYDDYMPF